MPNFNWTNKPAAHAVEVKLTFGDHTWLYSLNDVRRRDLTTADAISILVDGQDYGDFNHGLLAWDYLQTFK